MECEPCPARSELLANMQSMRVEYTFDHENLIEFLGKTASIVEQIPEKEPIEVIGYVHTLKNPDLARQTGSKVIFVTWERDGHDSVSLCVPLTDALYQKAIDAHKNQARIILRGFVERVGTRYWLQETTQLDFEFGNV